MHHIHAKRSGGRNYTAFSDDFIRNLFTSFPKEDISLKFAIYKGEIEAGAVTIRYGKKAAYYLGASDIKHPKFSPAYLVQWECIREAKEKGCEEYNFWGVTPDDNKNYPLYGVSLFKKGFGGFQHDLLHTQDLPITPRYYLSALIEWFFRKKKGYYYLPSQSKI